MNAMQQIWNIIESDFIPGKSRCKSGFMELRVRVMYSRIESNLATAKEINTFVNTNTYNLRQFGLIEPFKQVANEITAGSFQPVARKQTSESEEWGIVL